MTYLIADSGATKTDWLYADGAETTHIKTQGLHPSNLRQMEDSVDIRNQIGSLRPASVFFFGAGCGNPVSDEIVLRFLQPIFPEADIRIRSDLEGSGRAFFGNGSGVVAVLGTGSVSARIEHGKVVKKSAALGFAIGDEGSAADLGRRILKMYYRRTVSGPAYDFIREKLHDTDYATMMHRIYRSGKPNRELASIAGEVLVKPLPPGLTEIIRQGFGDFADHQLLMLAPARDETIIFTGKVAEIHKDLLIPLMREKGLHNVEVRYPVVASFRERIKNGENPFDGMPHR